MKIQRLEDFDLRQLGQTLARQSFQQQAENDESPDHCKRRAFPGSDSKFRPAIAEKRPVTFALAARI